MNLELHNASTGVDYSLFVEKCVKVMIELCFEFLHVQRREARTLRSAMFRQRNVTTTILGRTDVLMHRILIPALLSLVTAIWLCFDYLASDLEHTNCINGNDIWHSPTRCASLSMLFIHTSCLDCS
jgi:hypothetical protein